MDESRHVASGITVGIGILFVQDVHDIQGKVVGIPGFVEDRFPQPYRRVVAVTPHHVADVAVHALCEDRLLIPELPSRCVDNHEEPQLVAGIHKGGVLRIVGVADDPQAGIAQLLGVAPVQAVGESVADDGKILVVVGAD